jgi:hypothetical protein
MCVSKVEKVMLLFLSNLHARRPFAFVKHPIITIALERDTHFYTNRKKKVNVFIDSVVLKELRHVEQSYKDFYLYQKLLS